MEQPQTLDGHRAPDRPDVEVLIASVGEQVRRLRKLRQLTIEQLSRASGVSSGMLSQMERGIGNPSFNSLVQVAHALEVPVARLLQGQPAASPVVRRSERRSLTLHPAGPFEPLHQLLTPSLDGSLEAVWVETPPGHDTAATPYTHAGEEFGIVLEGRHQVFLDGTCHELGPGDSITYASSIPHWYRNPGPEAVKAIWVITPPTW